MRGEREKEEEEEGGVTGMSQQCMIQLDQMVSKNFPLMLILFM